MHASHRGLNPRERSAIKVASSSHPSDVRPRRGKALPPTILGLNILPRSSQSTLTGKPLILNTGPSRSKYAVVVR